MQAEPDGPPVPKREAAGLEPLQRPCVRYYRLQPIQTPRHGSHHVLSAQTDVHYEPAIKLGPCLFEAGLRGVATPANVGGR
ncbi:hypothetical protein NKR19_g8433 [Coniochaeta hoffmannii]|uniref:Uncharacterized protein n=1 Tax=Coniochaeta hoffmannii TaxID=91930 RepID=A0AA38R5P8_9PEZI|nr:hypothetical protein NKR19_g8433 [Coniochaeta hoffmannii]